MSGFFLFNGENAALKRAGHGLEQGGGEWEQQLGWGGGAVIETHRQQERAEAPESAERETSQQHHILRDKPGSIN